MVGIKEPERFGSLSQFQDHLYDRLQEIGEEIDLKNLVTMEYVEGLYVKYKGKFDSGDQLVDDFLAYAKDYYTLGPEDANERRRELERDLTSITIGEEVLQEYASEEKIEEIDAKYSGEDFVKMNHMKNRFVAYLYIYYCMRKVGVIPGSRLASE